jgi:hypothetical protein
MFINKVIHYQKNSSVRYGTPKPNVRKFHCILLFFAMFLTENLNYHNLNIKTGIALLKIFLSFLKLHIKFIE